jgi:tetratricopeptide (TPR) repeat protein
LDIELSFLEGLVQRDADDVDVLTLLSEGYARRGKLAEGMRIDEHLVTLKPNDARLHYNLACRYSLDDNCDAAARALQRAIDLGFDDFKWLFQDPDLTNLRNHPAYRKIWARVRAIQIFIA